MSTNLISNIVRLNLANSYIHIGNLVLVNRKNPINKPEPLTIKNLENVSTASKKILLDKTATIMLRKLIIACNGENEIVLVSGFRPLSEQIAIYNDSMKENGEEFTSKYVALPNHSEHQTGLAIDVAKNEPDIDFICPSFPNEGICQDFREKAAQYGFIERYPKGKEAITGISHEPWHFRYVGNPHSQIISDNNFTLEEYIEYLKQFPYDGMHLQIKNRGWTAKIFYVNAREEVKSVYLSENLYYEVSGNNIDGFIVTVWRQCND
ncbi:M15 family metallopeptidase [Clostridium sp. BNL1100]|uniref:M15 family metallopeptidase n=1 Tax=Clostridium sp. BNL1100 TaxID=755731 RepID=UPI00024A7DEF|nr:M15 family metallopeptidase [Clostridium sp. BNL1100]AEY66221.1 D-alanyl-D-alanine carboxypeptidase [Clostridium sp. BNL1100]